MNESNLIELVPYGGLSNRMRAIASAYEIALINNSKLIVYWGNTSECFASFHDLFIQNDKIIVKTIDKKQFYLKRPTRSNLYLPAVMTFFFKRKLGKYYVELAEKWGGGFFRKLIFLNTGDRTRTNSILKRPIAPLITGSCLVFTCHSLKDDFELNNLFNPTIELQSIIREKTKKFPDKTIGLHIRQTDNILSIRKSPLLLFHQAIQSEIKKDKNITFFLSTDSLSVKNELYSEYGDRIIFNDLPLDRNSINGIQGAVIDLWCLSKTMRIYGSFYSTFSEMAAKIGNINYEILQ